MLTVLGDDVELVPGRTRDAVPRSLVAKVAVIRNAGEEAEPAVSLECIDVDRVVPASDNAITAFSYRKRCDARVSHSHVRDVSPLADRINVDGVGPVPERDPRLVRLRVVEFALPAGEVDHLLHQFAVSARLLVDRKRLRDGTAGLVDPRRKGERRRRDGQVRSRGRCVVDDNRVSVPALYFQHFGQVEKKTHRWARC